MGKKLAIRALQRGIGSMDLIDMLLIMEDPYESRIAPLATPLDASELPAASLGSSVIKPTPPLALNPVGATAGPRPTSSLENSPEPVPEWCKCGQCRTMPQQIENKCCNQRSRVSLTRRFSKLCLDSEYFQLSIRNTGGVRNYRDDNSSRAFRKTVYRNSIIDKYGYRGKNKKKLCPSCCVLKIWQHFSSATGVHMGFGCS